MVTTIERKIDKEHLSENGPLLVLTPLPIPDPIEQIEFYQPTFDLNNKINTISTKENLKGLLIKITNNEQLDTVTQIKLKVITRDLPLQQLSLYTPALRELILDGSIISTLRDLGYGLNNLKILKINRCGLEYLDGLICFENLEELYASDNFIQDITSCSMLKQLKILNVERNCLKNFNSIKSLILCENLEHIHLRGNHELSNLTNNNYKNIIKMLLPSLKSLDRNIFIDDDNNSTDEETKDIVSIVKSSISHCQMEDEYKDNKHNKNKSLLDVKQSSISSSSLSNNNNSDNSGSSRKNFTIKFPPRVFHDGLLQQRKKFTLEN